jgi:hypothetical protein
MDDFSKLIILLPLESEIRELEIATGSLKVVDFRM